MPRRGLRAGVGLGGGAGWGPVTPRGGCPGPEGRRAAADRSSPLRFLPRVSAQPPHGSRSECLAATSAKTQTRAGSPRRGCCGARREPPFPEPAFLRARRASPGQHCPLGAASPGLRAGGEVWRSRLVLGQGRPGRAVPWSPPSANCGVCIFALENFGRQLGAQYSVWRWIGFLRSLIRPLCI